MFRPFTRLFPQCTHLFLGTPNIPPLYSPVPPVFSRNSACFAHIPSEFRLFHPFPLGIPPVPPLYPNVPTLSPRKAACSASVLACSARIPSEFRLFCHATRIFRLYSLGIPPVLPCTLGIPPVPPLYPLSTECSAPAPMEFRLFYPAPSEFRLFRPCTLLAPNVPPLPLWNSAFSTLHPRNSACSAPVPS